MTLRDAKDVNEVNKDWYTDSLEVAQVEPLSFASCYFRHIL